MSIAQKTTIQAYQLKAGGTRARMAILRMIAADSVNNPNVHTRLTPGDWRGARSYTLGSYADAYCFGLYAGSDGREPYASPVWYSHGGEQFRNEQDAGDILGGRMRGNAWYTDSDGNETAIGIVGRLSHGRFIAGYRWTSNDERVYFPEIYDDDNDAARAADSHAESFAESAREDSERFDAMSDAENECETLTETFRDDWRIYKAARVAYLAQGERFDVAHGQAYMAVSETINKLREARETLAEKTAEYEKG